MTRFYNRALISTAVPFDNGQRNYVPDWHRTDWEICPAGYFIPNPAGPSGEFIPVPPGVVVRNAGVSGRRKSRMTNHPGLSPGPVLRYCAAPDHGTFVSELCMTRNDGSRASAMQNGVRRSSWCFRPMPVALS